MRQRLLVWLVCALAWLWSAPAKADPALTVPSDVPVLLQPSAVHIPAVPAAYLHKNLGWLEVHYVASLHERVQPLIRDAEETKASLAEMLDQPILQHVEVRIARTPEEMAQLAPEGAPPPSYASGVAYPALGLVLLTAQAPITSEAPDLDEVFRHELAHVALENAVRGHHVPLWFNEGLAVHASGESVFARYKTLADAAVSNSVLSLGDLDRHFPSEHYEVNIAYAESADFVRHLLRRADRQRFATMVARVRDGQSFDRTLADAYGTDLRKLEFEWREDLAKRFKVWPAVVTGSTLWIAVIGAMAIAWFKRRRRAQATLARWAEEEALEDARMHVHADTEIAKIDPAIAARASVPKIEHDGRWHTLH